MLINFNICFLIINFSKGVKTTFLTIFAGRIYRAGGGHFNILPCPPLSYPHDQVYDDDDDDDAYDDGDGDDVDDGGRPSCLLIFSAILMTRL